MKRKRGSLIPANPLILLARPEGFEPSTFGFVEQENELLLTAVEWHQLTYIPEVSNS